MSLERESTGGAVVVDPLGGLVLDPANELRFKGPFDDYVTVSLMIRNPTEKRIAFKIKTTAPKRYCVKPNSGVLDQGQSMKVNVLLQPFTYDPNEKNKHKFMVQYLYLNEDEINLAVNEILNMWKDVPQSRLLDLKLKCIFDFTEAEQQKLANQQPVNDQTNVNSSTTSVSSVNTEKQQEKISKPVVAAPVATAPGPTATKIQTTSPSTTTTTTNTTTKSVSDTDTFESNNNKSINNGARLEKNDNLLNELKLENENLKKQIETLKAEEARLRKLSISASPTPASPSGPTDFSDLLNNRQVFIIILLIAIIVYLLLFR